MVCNRSRGPVEVRDSDGSSDLEFCYTRQDCITTRTPSEQLDSDKQTAHVVSRRHNTQTPIELECAWNLAHTSCVLCGGDCRRWKKWAVVFAHWNNTEANGRLASFTRLEFAQKTRASLGSSSPPSIAPTWKLIINYQLSSTHLFQAQSSSFTS